MALNSHGEFPVLRNQLVSVSFKSIRLIFHLITKHKQTSEEGSGGSVGGFIPVMVEEMLPNDSVYSSVYSGCCFPP